MITGGSKGLGKEIVNLYLQDGWNVIELSRSGNTRHHVDINLANPEIVSKCIEETLDSLSGKIIEELVLINNAATLSPIRNIKKLKDAEIHNSININITSAIIITRRFIETFRDYQIKKTLVNISSGAAQKAYSGWSLYCTGKAGMENFFNTLFIEERSEAHPFRIINFDPYIMDTSMQREIRASKREDFPSLDRFISFKEDNKLVQPSDVAKAIKTLTERDLLNGSRYEAKKMIDEL